MNPIWQAIARFILRNRILLLIILGVLTSFMWMVRGQEVSQSFGKVIPKYDPTYVEYQDFKKEFGEDGNVIVLGLEGDIFDKDYFGELYKLSEGIKELDGIDGVISLSHLEDLIANVEEGSFSTERLLSKPPETEAEMDSMAAVIKGLRFYTDLLLNDSANVTLVGVSLTDEALDSRRKIELYDEIKKLGGSFEEQTGSTIRYAGMPLLRIFMSTQIPKELVMFMGLALLVTSLVLLWFFRSWLVLVYPTFVIGTVLIWTFGIMGLLGYEYNLTTGIIPSLITVIGIPNCIYLLTKYHIEYKRTRNKVKALVLIIEKIGIVTVMTNATTAVGFGVLAFTDISLLNEFGLVAGLSVLCAFVISLLMIPTILSFLPPPTTQQVAYLDRQMLTSFIGFLDYSVHHRRPLIYGVSITIAVVAAWGMYSLVPVSYMVDDIPNDHNIHSDLQFMETHFGGAMPFEIVIEGEKKRQMVKNSSLKRLNKLQEKLKEYPELSKTLSIANVASYARQSVFGEYGIPSRSEYGAIRDLIRHSEIDQNVNKRLNDSLFQKARISGSVKDVGSKRLEVLLDSVEQDIISVFDTSKFTYTLTGTTRIYVKGNQYIIENLVSSLLIAFMVIALLMGFLFRSVRVVIISLVPNFLPLLVVAGIMGFCGVPLKPSTALVFSVVFGIAVDDSIHFLARYRLGRKNGNSVAGAVSESFQDTGVSMIYTSLILFTGFVIFVGSSFGGIQALGLLSSITLFIAMLSNLLLLPSLLLSLDS